MTTPVSSAPPVQQQAPVQNPGTPQQINPKAATIALVAYVGLAALCAVGAAYAGAATLLGGSLIVLASVLTLCSIGIALEIYKGLSSNKPEEQLGKHHPLDLRQVSDPVKIGHRIAKATAQAAAAGEGAYNKAFDTALQAPNPFTGHSAAIDVGGTKVGVAELQGMRPTMEDRHIASQIKFTSGGAEQNAKVFGIFDGHGGDEASDFVSKNIESYLSKNLSLYCETGITDAGIYQALRQTFVELDADCHLAAGTTACVTVMINGDLYVANAGDARAVLKNGDSNMPRILGGYTAQALSKDQKPASPDMLKGINNRGGVVIQPPGHPPRVNGNLAVARSIGDWTMLDLDGNQMKVVSPLPKISKISAKEIQKGSELIIACDGLYDVTPSSSQVAKAVKSCKTTGKDNKMTAEAMATAAVQAGSTDNVSVMVITL